MARCGTAVLLLRTAKGGDPPAGLADRTHALWVGFARDGTLPWRPYDGERLVYQLAQGDTRIEPPMPAADFLPG